MGGEQGEKLGGEETRSGRGAGREQNPKGGEERGVRSGGR